MSINMRGLLSADTFRALEQLYSERNWADLYPWAEPEQVAWLTFRLQFVPDDAETFPRGKWATIQHLQDMVSDAAQDERREIETEGKG